MRTGAQALAHWDLPRELPDPSSLTGPCAAGDPRAHAILRGALFLLWLRAVGEPMDWCRLIRKGADPRGMIRKRADGRARMHGREECVLGYGRRFEDRA